MQTDPSMTSRWSLVTYGVGDDLGEHVGILRADNTVCAVPALSEYRGLMPAIENWPDVSAILESYDPDLHEPIPSAKILAPLRYPKKILCAGANYWSHLREMGGTVDQEVVDDPFFFLLPATAIVGPGEPIKIPVDDDAMVDWEGELAVVIGQPARNVTVESASAYVAGYTICNDVSARGLHRRASYSAPPFEWDWLKSKGRDTFLPIGPGVTPSWLVDDPHDLRLRVWVNGELKQDARTSDLIVDIWQLIAAASALVTLEPGDVITTGTPAGVGASRGEFLRLGDVVTVEIEKLGRLSNPVRTESEAPVVVESALPTANPDGSSV
jgi:2-keto-4-pentenoate hydratase/2-oxohepta-3-ene-1,7-dioic acid hydratase in catechol pathway